MVVQNRITPEIFTMPPSNTTPTKPGQLSDTQVKKFFEEGYVLVEDLLTEKELEPCRRNINELVDELAHKLYDAGKIKDLYADYGFFERLTKLEHDFPGSVIILHKLGAVPPAICDLLANEKLLNIAEQLLGTTEVWNLRTKTPQTEAAVVPWHQDSSYFDERSYNELILTAWIPFLDANAKNGCLEMAKFAHKSGRVVEHVCCAGDTWYLMFEPNVMSEQLGVNLNTDLEVVPVKYGSVLLFNNLTPHRSLDNMSNQVRWSVDLRWQRADVPDLFYGLKQPILLRSAKQPSLKPDWDTFNSVDRHTLECTVGNEESASSWIAFPLDAIQIKWKTIRSIPQYKVRFHLPSFCNKKDEKSIFAC